MTLAAATKMIQIAADSTELKNILMTSRYETDGRVWQALPTRVIRSPEKVIFFELKAIDRTTPFSFFSTLKILWISVRPFSLTATATPCLFVYLLGVIQFHWQANGVAAACAILAASLAQMAVNVLNDVEDHLRFIDLPGQTDGQMGGSGVIQSGRFSAATLKAYAIGLAIAGAAFGIYPLTLALKPLLVLGVGGTLLALQYSSPPLSLKYRAWGDAAVIALCGPVLTAGFSFAIFQKANLSIALAGLIFGFAADAILHANNLNDLELDQSSGAVTVASKLGFVASKRFFAAIYIFMVITICVMAGARSLPLASLVFAVILAPKIWSLSRRVLAATGPLSPSISKIRFESAQVHLLIGILLCAGIVVSRFMSV